MKRLFIAVWITLVAASAGTPAVIQPISGHIRLAPATAAACADGEVELSVKVNSKNDSNCVKPDANGGVIVTYLKIILKFLSGGVGLVIVLMITIAAVQYITAAGQPEQVKAAKNRIQNALTALVLFLTAFAILNLIIPGGIFT